MFVLKDKISLGYSCGRVVLIDTTGVLSTQYLSTKSSMLFVALLNLETDNERYKFLVDCNIATDFFNAKKQLQALISMIRDYIYILDNTEVWNIFKKCKVNIERLTQGKSKKSLNEYRLDSPASLVWVPTWKCNRSCLYCGVAKIQPNDKEEQMSVSRVYEMFDEMIAMGMNTISIHGGEPLFLYGEHIFDMIKYLTTHGVNYIQISTKNHISLNMAKRLHESGLKDLQLSLDAVDDNILYEIYGEKSILSKFADSVMNLQKENINVKVNIVVSSLNYKYVPDLLIYLNNLLVNVVSMSPYRSGPVNKKNFTLTSNQQQWLYNQIEKIKDIFIFDNIFGSFSNTSLVEACQRAVCEAGRISMLILPDGRSCYCDYLSEKDSFIFGDYKTQSLQEIWDSSELYNFMHPKREDFNETICYDCPSLDNCLNKGLCFLSIPEDRLYGPDYKCIECITSIPQGVSLCH